MAKVKYLNNEKQLETVTPLSEALERFLRERVTPCQGQWESITQLWQNLIPATLREHCRIKEIAGGLLKITVDSPVYMHELRLCKDELLREIQNRCTGQRVKKIKIILERN